MRRSILFLIGALLAAAACGVSAVSTPESSSPLPGATATASPVPTATPTPIPLALLIEPEGGPVAPLLQPWAEGRSWEFERIDAEGTDLRHVRDMPGLSVVVSVEAGFGGEITALAVAGFPVITIDVADLQPAERLSTLGEPGARHDQAGFLAGMMAGLATRTGWVGLIEETGGTREAVYRNAFVHGLQYACPACTLVTLSPGEVTVDAFRAKGVDSVFAVPGREAESALERLADAGIWIVHIGERQVSIPDPQVAGRVVFEPEQALTQALEALMAGEPGDSWPASLEYGSLRVADLNPEAISPGRERLLREAIEALVADELDIGVDPYTGEAH